MKVILEDLSHFLNNVVRPIADFVKRSAITDPMVRLYTRKGELYLESSSGNRTVNAHINSAVKEGGDSYILSSALTGVKSSHKRAILEVKKNKLSIKSGDANRKMVMEIDTISNEGYPSTKEVKASKGKIGRISLAKMQDALTKININPILVPGVEQATVSMHVTDDGRVRILVNDSHRVMALETDEKKGMQFKDEIITDFKEILGILSVTSSLSESAVIVVTKKRFETLGYDEDKNRKIAIRMSHSVPNVNLAQRVKILYEKALKEKSVMGFVPDESFQEVLENIVTLANLRSKQGVLDIHLRKKSLMIAGSGPSSTYKETVGVKKVQGAGSVRVAANVLADIIRLFSEDAIIKITKSSIVVKNNWEDDDETTYFILPFLAMEKK
jgi:hypothetical protein